MCLDAVKLKKTSAAFEVVTSNDLSPTAAMFSAIFLDFE